jgi:hypothetical protein
VRRRLALVALAGAIGVAACREGTVVIEPDPQVGDRASYRYEIEAQVTSRLEGAEPTTEDISTELLVDQEVVAITPDGVQASVTLRRDGLSARDAQVVLDASGGLRAVELVEGLPSDVLGAAQLGALFPPISAPPPGPLAPGARWTIDEGTLRGHGRLERLGVVDGEDIAVVTTTLTDAIDELVTAGTSTAALAGDLRSRRSVTYDLRDGALRRSTARSRGDVQATIQPPPGIQAAPVLATISYVIEVRVARLD